MVLNILGAVFTVEMAGSMPHVKYTCQWGIGPVKGLKAKAVGVGSTQVQIFPPPNITNRRQTCHFFTNKNNPYTE